MYKSDTICAVATGLGRSAIGIIRVSGPEAIQICDKVFVGKKCISEMKSFTAAFGKICDGDKVLDEAIVLVMKGPKTYTTEDWIYLTSKTGKKYTMRMKARMANNKTGRETVLEIKEPIMDGPMSDAYFTQQYLSTGKAK
jgi:tRNA U34 5-carboxymethylaminomethyl modifying GTPase MnmE/TrmE